MFIILRGASFIFFGFLVLAANSWAQGTSTFEGVVKDGKGQPVKGAEVRVETKSERIIAKGRTDARGHYATKPVPAGTYKVDLVLDSITKATLPSAKTNSSGATQLNFDIKGTPKKRMVWIGETGSHLGRWVEADDANATAGANNVSKGNSETVRRMQERSGQALPGGN